MCYPSIVDSYPSLDIASWREMVCETVPRQPDAFERQQELLSTCCLYSDYAEAQFWAEYFNIPKNRQPILLQDFTADSNNISQTSAELTASDTWEDIPSTSDTPKQGVPEDFLTLSLPSNCINHVQNASQFSTMLNDLRSQRLIAFDSEWKPTFCSDNELAIVQLATRQRVYIVDVANIKLPNVDDWHQLANTIFANEDIVKLAFSPASDLVMFGKSMPGFANVHQTIAGCLDLQLVWQHLNSLPRHQFRFPCDGDRFGSSLSGLVQLCLGKKLDKSNQFSNWQQRPLRAEQVQYAALDAYCLMEIYDVMEAEYNRRGGDFNQVLNTLLVDRPKSTARSTSNRRERGKGGRGGHGRGQKSQTNQQGSTRREEVTAPPHVEWCPPDWNADRSRSWMDTQDMQRVQCDRCASEGFISIGVAQMRDMVQSGSNRYGGGPGNGECDSLQLLIKNSNPFISLHTANNHYYTNQGVPIEWYSLPRHIVTDRSIRCFRACEASHISYNQIVSYF